MSGSKISLESCQDLEKTGLPIERTIAFHDDGAVPVLERAVDAAGISHPEGTAATLIPIGYRTLSIQVYDSQRVDQAPSSHKKGEENDAHFFGQLDFHGECTLPIIADDVFKLSMGGQL
jgi:hypothetical protein